MLIPAAARPWLAPDTRERPWLSHGAMMVRRREALAALQPAYGSWPRFGLAALAWALGVAGAVLVGWGVAEESSAHLLGIGLLVAATALGGVVVATGAALARAVADWWTLATGVRADGAPVDAVPDPDTLRAHREAVTADRTQGAGQLWRLPLLPRTAAALLLSLAAAVLVAQAAAGYAEIATPFAGPDVRGPWLGRVLLAATCLLTAALTASGLRRIHRARMHRVAHRPHDQARRDPAPAALGTGAIVVGGRGPTSPRPQWADTVGSAAGAAGPAPAGPPPPAPGPHPADEAAGPHLADEAAGPHPADEATGPHPETPDPPTPAQTAPHTPRVRLGDGRELPAGTTLLGRAPSPRSGEHADALLAVADESVSKTHLTVQVGNAVVVADRGSTNGTVVHHPDGRRQPLRPGEPQELADGAVVLLGAMTLTVGQGADDLEHTVLRQ